MPIRRRADKLLVMTQRKLRILVVEDEAAIRNGLVDVLVFHGYDVTDADTGQQGLQMALGGTFDLILLDVMLPGVDGFEICNQVRARDREQAIIMLTAKTSDEDIVQGLTLGADDYIAKPFSVAQLVLRVQAVLRRSRAGQATNDRMELSDGVTIDLANLRGQKGGDELAFTRREIEILQYLDVNSTRPVPRDELLAKVWGYGKDLDIATRTVDIHIAKLRRKIEPEPATPRHLITVRGVGYRLIRD